jgi:rhodanese-related sulfurtransferase
MPCPNACRRFDTVIDARTEDEYALDHIPGAVNWPTLYNAERVQIGTLYKQVNAFEAKKRGAALSARNIAAHIERAVLDKPKSWKPLVYCWRGGNRSGALATILSAIGFQVTLVEGGYKAWRHALLATLPARVEPLNFPDRLRPHRLGQDPPAAGLGGRRCPGAGPGSAGLPPQLGAGGHSWPATAQPEVV